MTEDKSTVVVEDLMEPRYKVIADYPGNHHPIGKVINGDYGMMHYDTRNNFDSYPAIFKKLEWWEERKIEDMPEYLKTKSGKIIKIEEHFVGLNNNYVQWDHGRSWYSYTLSTLSTESEYNQYINQKATT